MMILTGRFATDAGLVDIVKCTGCGKERNETKGVNPSKLKCKCEGEIK